MGSALQAGQDSNPFFHSHNTQGSSTETASGPAAPDTDDDPPPAPVDNYIPLLVLSAVAIITYTMRRRKKMSN